MEENRKKLEEANRRRIEENVRKMEMMKKQQEEQRATLQIRRAIQKVRICVPETFEMAKTELEAMLVQELKACGTQEERVREEAQKGIQESAVRMEQIKEARKQEEERRIVEEKRRKEALEKAHLLLGELEKMVVVAEEAFKKFKESSEPLAEEKEFELSEVKVLADALTEAGDLSKAKLKECTDFITKNGQDMKEPPGTPPTEGKTTFQQLLQRITEMKRHTESILAQYKDKATKMIKKGEADKQVSLSEALFSKYDKDGDGFLSKKEVQAYSKGEFSFTMPMDSLDLVTQVLFKESKGVSKADFHYLTVSVGVARDRVKDAERRAQREAHEKKLADMKEDLQKKIAAANEAATEAEGMAAKVDPLLKEAGEGASAIAQVKTADEVDKLMQEAKEGAESSKTMGEEMVEGVEKDLEPWIKAQAGFLNNRLKKLETLLKELALKSERLREEAKKKEMVELMELRKSALSVMRYHQKTKKLTNEGLFEEISTNDKVDEVSFLKFFETCEKEPVKKEEGKDEDAEEVVSGPSPEELSRVFSVLDEDEEGFMTKEQFLRCVRQFKKVVKDSVITTEIGLREGKTHRRLAIGEALEILEGPYESENIMRARAKVMADGIDGWVTVTGNAGSAFIEDGGNHFKVVKETILTECFDVGATKDKSGKAASTRKLKEGEVVEVLEWPVKQESTGLVRLMCRTQSDYRLGWATTIGNTGTVFLEAA